MGLIPSAADEPIIEPSCWFERGKGKELPRIKLKGLENDSRFFIRAMEVPDLDPSKVSWYTRKYYVPTTFEGKSVWVNINSLSKRLLLSAEQIQDAAAQGKLEDLMTTQARTLSLMQDSDIRDTVSQEKETKVRDVHSEPTLDDLRKTVVEHPHLFQALRKNRVADRDTLEIIDSKEDSRITFKDLLWLAGRINDLVTAKETDTAGEFLFHLHPEKDDEKEKKAKSRTYTIYHLGQANEKGELGKKLGEGGSGTVTRVLNVATGVFYAMKKPKRGNLQEWHDRQKSMDEEAYILQQVHKNGRIKGIQPPHIVVRQSHVHMDFIMEEMVPVWDWLKQDIPAPKRIDACKQFMQALNRLWAAGYTHRDLKPDNLLMTKEGELIIGDLGGARPFDRLYEPDVYTPGYLSPLDKLPPNTRSNQEARKQYSIQRDLYAAGQTMFAILLGKELKSVEWTPEGRRKALAAKGLDDAMITVLEGMIQNDPKARIPAEEAMKAWGVL